LEAKLDEEGRESSDLGTLHQRLSEELEDERKQHLKILLTMTLQLIRQGRSIKVSASRLFCYHSPLKYFRLQLNWRNSVKDIVDTNKGDYQKLQLKEQDLE
jgi:hypothetical protein